MAEPIASNTEPHLTTEEEMKQAQINLKLQAANARAEKAERSLLDDHVTLMLRAEKAERERDQFAAQAGQLRDLADTVRGQRDEAERERDTLRAELARLTAPGAATEAQYREQSDFDAGVAHERARQQPAKGRATDEELVGVYTHGYDTLAHETRDPFSKSHYDCKRAAVAAVAARVRQERCLVAQAVADPLLDSVSVGAVMGGGIRVRIVRRVDSLANTLGETKDVFCERANVPATLARLLGEVSRG